MRTLFVCSANRLRSPTAEHVFASWMETDSAGLANDADQQLSAEQIEWADIIFVLAKVHRRKLAQRFRSRLNGKKLICLDIPESDGFLDPALIALLEAKARPHLL